MPGVGPANKHGLTATEAFDLLYLASPQMTEDQLRTFGAYLGEALGDIMPIDELLRLSTYPFVSHLLRRFTQLTKDPESASSLKTDFAKVSTCVTDVLSKTFPLLPSAEQARTEKLVDGGTVLSCVNPKCAKHPALTSKTWTPWTGQFAKAVARHYRIKVSEKKEEVE